MSIESIWNYYKKVADEETKWDDSKTKTGPDPLSLTFFYSPDSTAAKQNELVRAFLQDPELQWSNEPVDNFTPESIQDSVSQVTKPYAAQMEAICNALNYPLSIVQGPPGTGKTEMILNLLAVIHNRFPHSTVALVSSNGEAVKNIFDKIEEASSKEKYDPVFAELYDYIAMLGNKSIRKKWCETIKERGLNIGDNILIGDNFRPEFLERFPIFSSTIHSLRKNFIETANFHNQFDFVIMDEASQTNIMLGIIAMSCAKQMVIIGDDKQLAPIIKKTAVDAGNRQEYNGVDDIYKEAEGKSFLSVCERVFHGKVKSVFLNRHFRCLPSIIGFCNKYVYNNALDVKTQEEGFHIRAVWYDGDYCEKYVTDNNMHNVYNMKQIEIFVNEELPRIQTLIRQNNNLSVMVVAPFREQIERLETALNEYDGINDDEGLVQNNIYSLTIHKSQGKGFDIVYMLTTEDYKTCNKSPWCQRMRMMNVAVSRAKKEFCIITSSQWLPPEIRKEYSVNYIDTELPYNLSDPEGMFFCKLLEYVKDNCPEPSGDYGFHKSRIVSVFDRVPYIRQKYNTGTDCSSSAPERLVYEMLENIVSEYPDEENYCVLREVPLTCFELYSDVINCGDDELLEFVKYSRADFVVCKGEQVRLILEVDGGYHRKNRGSQEACDKNKDSWIKEILDAGDFYLRLPTDGTTKNERVAVKEKIDNSVNSDVKIDLKKIKEMRSVVRKSDVIEVLNDRIATAFGNLRKAYWDDREKLLKCLANINNYANAQNAVYDNEIANNYYLCRYAKAYAFEYALMYDIVMRSYIRNGGHDQLGVFSFGCGSMIDALSMLYSKVCLIDENNCYANCRLYYKGIDAVSWVGSAFMYPLCLSLDLCQSELDQRLRGGFENIYFFEDDLIFFLNKKIIKGQYRRVYHNVLFFPKILNELSDQVIDELCEKLEKMNFVLNEYYICVSHSRFDFEKGAGASIVDRMIYAVNRDGRFEVCSNIWEMLGDEQEKFRKKWLGTEPLNDNLIPLQSQSYPQSPHTCYVFESSLRPNNYEKNYIYSLNNDFSSDDVVEDFLVNTLGAEYSKVEKESEHRFYPIKRVSQIAFQIIRLKRNDQF